MNLEMGHNPLLQVRMEPCSCLETTSVIQGTVIRDRVIATWTKGERLIKYARISEIRDFTFPVYHIEVQGLLQRPRGGLEGEHKGRKP